MNESLKKKRFMLASAIGILLCMLLSRTAAVLYTTAATDILYSEGILPDLLSLLRQLFSVAAFGVGIAAVTGASAFGKKTCIAMAGIHVALQLADASAAFIIDAVSGAVSAALLAVAALMNLGEWLLGAILTAIIAAVLLRMAKAERSSARMLGTASLIYLAGRLALQLYSVTVFLIDVEFMPYASELVQIAGELFRVLFFGGIVWLAASAAYAILVRILRSVR